TLQVASGATLTLRGADLVSNTLGLINKWSVFAPQPGSTIIGDVAGDYTSILLNKGQISAVGTSGSHIAFTIPSSYFVWSNSIASEVQSASANWPYDGTQNIGLLSLLHDWVSNSGGTGP